MRDHNSEIHLQAVFVEQFSDHLVNVYHKLEAQIMSTPGDESRKPLCLVLGAHSSLMALQAALVTVSMAASFGGRMEKTLMGKRSNGTPYMMWRNAAPGFAPPCEAW